MKKIIVLLIGGALLSSVLAFGQPGRLPPGPFAVNPAPDQNLVRFDLDFPGGTPRQLVEAIEKGSGRPLNAIISDEYADFRLPPLKMRSVTAPELFEALRASSFKIETFASGYARGPGSGLTPQFSPSQSQYGFKTIGQPKDDAVWFFYAEKPWLRPEAKTCRFWQLAPYLETYKVDDITTAIQTGWKMLGETTPPTISFHKDTKLLIAVGDEGKLQLIDSVLEQLAKGKTPVKDVSAAKSAEAGKR